MSIISAKQKKSLYTEIVRKDCYLLKCWKINFFDYILDIGANIGLFSLYVNFLHYNAKIFAYEPCKKTFNYLIENTNYIDNTKYIQKALGDGSNLYLYDTGYSGCNLFFKKDETDKKLDSQYTRSLSLGDMFEKNKILMNSRFFIKMDCEGGERFLLYDNLAINIIRNSHATAIEVHFPPTKTPRNEAAERFKTFPTWEIYNNWIHDNFEKTHEIVYHCSSGRNGAGVYVLLKKESSGLIRDK
ncbi:hypothetical protein LCGC14_2575380 [marine sediment metagenome]|uniref:Methyltransferase FkbM domain-containing protein n=1 Tax=marine sediment metagenome TaxID=412755 RepID=A0A0F9CS76_9ZZZZ